MAAEVRSQAPGFERVTDCGDAAVHFAAGVRLPDAGDFAGAQALPGQLLVLQKR